MTDGGEKVKEIDMYWQTNFIEIFVLKPLVVGKLSFQGCKMTS